MQLSIRHTTRYEFASPVTHGLQRLRLTPKSNHGQQVADWTMVCEGLRTELDFEDHHQNRITLATVIPGATSVTIACAGTVTTADNRGIVGQHSGDLPLWTFLSQSPLTRPGTRMRALASGIAVDRTRTLALLHALSDAVGAAVRYEPGQTNVLTSAEEAIAAGCGVCQDHAHVFIGAARLLGVPARYVSGYLLMDDRIEQDAGHGWAEAHVEGLGWVGFDVANEICPDERYVRVATGCDYREAAPVTGFSAGSGETALSVALTVEQQDAAQ